MIIWRNKKGEVGLISPENLVRATSDDNINVSYGPCNKRTHERKKVSFCGLVGTLNVGDINGFVSKYPELLWEMVIKEKRKRRCK